MEHNWMGDCENFHRRDFLRVGMLSVLGLSMSQYFALAEGAEKIATAESAKKGAPTGKRQVRRTRPS